MSALDDSRTELANAVTAAGIECLPYPPDAPAPPLAFVDNLTMDFTANTYAQSFCVPGLVTATIVTIAQRNDMPGSTNYLEGFIPAVLDSLFGIAGLRIVSAQSGQANVGGQDLPAVVYVVQFGI